MQPSPSRIPARYPHSAGDTSMTKTPEEQSTLVYVPTSELRPANWNPRVVYTEQFHQLMAMIRADPTFLQARPILAMDDGTIYAGAQRYRALCQLYRGGWEGPWQT